MIQRLASRRNSVIIALAAAASIAASFAGYYAAEAQKDYSLHSADLITAQRLELQADDEERQDEMLINLAKLESYKNDTRVAHQLLSSLSQNAKDYMYIDGNNISSISLTPKYYDSVLSDYVNSNQVEHHHLDLATQADEYSRTFIILTSVLSAGVVIFSELSRRKEAGMKPT